MRFMLFVAASLAFASIVLLYAVNYDARRLEARNQAEERALQSVREEIAVLRAERAYLARPDRIEPLARALGLRPAEAAQFAVAEPGANAAGAAVPPAGGSPSPRGGP